jgi:putative ABC transport system permease protein
MNAFALAWRYVTHYRVKSVVMMIALMLVVVLPITAQILMSAYGQALVARADATPLVLGTRGHRFDLVLKSLYFRPAKTEPIYADAWDRLDDPNFGLAIPLQLEFTAGDGYPVVGTNLEYFAFRGLNIATGRQMVQLGEAVLGSELARLKGLAPGDVLRSDQVSYYNLAAMYPLQMDVVGVLDSTGTSDDRAVFVDVKTAWIMAGLMHGHQDLSQESVDSGVVLRRDEHNVTANAALREYTRVTAENRQSFHLHAERNQLPLSAVLFVPKDDKSATIIGARYNVGEGRYRMLTPREVVDELLGVVFRIRQFFDANLALVGIATMLFLGVITLLSVQLRRAEFATFSRLGAPRGFVWQLLMWEFVILLGASAGAAGGLALLAVWVVSKVIPV